MNHSHGSENTIYRTTETSENNPGVRSVMIISMIISGLGIIGNCFTFHILRKHRHVNFSNTFLLRTLAMADILFLIFSFIYSAFATFTFQLTYWDLFVFHIPKDITGNYSAIVLTILSADRYILICHPLQARRWCTIANAKKSMLLGMICTILFHLDFVFLMIGIDRTIPLKFRYTMRILLLVILVFLNVRIIFELTRADRLHRKMTGNQTNMVCKMKGFVINLVFLAFIYVAGSIPYFCKVSDLFEEGSYDSHFLAHHLLSIMNSSINFVVYCLCFRTFRHTIKTIYCPVGQNLITNV